MSNLPKPWIYFFLSLITLILGIVLINFGREVPILRGAGGDFLIVIFMYTAIKTVLVKVGAMTLGTYVFLFASFLEWLQYFEIPKHYLLEHQWVQLAFGSTFDPLDIMMYGLGIIAIVLFDMMVLQER